MTTQEALLAKLLEKIEEVESCFGSTSILHQKENTTENRLSLTEKEIMKMPKNVRKQFRINGRIVKFRKRTTGRYKCSYEIRYAQKPYDKHPITASGTTLELAKERFIAKLNQREKQQSNSYVVPTDFNSFSLYWFENFHKRKVAENTFKCNFNRYKKHISVFFDGYDLTDINPVMLQGFLDSYNEKGKTKDELHSLLNQILTSAVKHGLISLNPLGMCFHKPHEKIHGKALTKEEEKMLLDSLSGSPYQISFAVILYTGLRPNEYGTAVIEGDFIKAVNSKRHGANGKVFYKKIPITPMLKPYLKEVKELIMPKRITFNSQLKAVLPTHKLYDIRTTFQTRCTECGISDTVIGRWMGNSIGALKDAYTDLSDSYLLQEGKKFKY